MSQRVKTIGMPDTSSRWPWMENESSRKAVEATARQPLMSLEASRDQMRRNQKLIPPVTEK